MRVLVFEFVCGGGCLGFPDFGEPTGSLLREGQAMLQAAVKLLEDSDSITPVVSLDHRLANQLDFDPKVATTIVHSRGDLTDFLQNAGHTCDKHLVIAPEIENALLKLVSDLEEHGKLICPGTEVINICSDKWETHRFFARNGLPTPRTTLGSDAEHGSAAENGHASKLVFKPRLGAGSQGVHVFNQLDDRSGLPEELHTYCQREHLSHEEVIVQEYKTGLPASIAVWKSDRQEIYFPVMKQCFRNGTFEFDHSEGPLGADSQNRSEKLLRGIVDRLPDFRGYLGADLCLGASPHDDCVIELNARLTTSFVQTRQLVDNELLRSMILES